MEMDLRGRSARISGVSGSSIRGLAFSCATAGMVGALAMTCAHGTVMPSSCRNVPTIESCVWQAQIWITDQCLRDCVIAGCRGVRIDCSSLDTLETCGKPKGPGKRSGGFAPPLGHDCKSPGDEVSWCELALGERCRAIIMVHELAHTCGWRHKGGLGVPGDDGTFQCD